MYFNEIESPEDFQQLRPTPGIVSIELKPAGRPMVEGKQELGPPGSRVWTASWLGNTRHVGMGLLSSSAGRCESFPSPAVPQSGFSVTILSMIFRPHLCQMFFQFGYLWPPVHIKPFFLLLNLLIVIMLCWKRPLALWVSPVSCLLTSVSSLVTRIPSSFLRFLLCAWPHGVTGCRDHAAYAVHHPPLIASHLLVAPGTPET